MEPMIVARNVHKRYGQIEVLKGIDLEVDAGKVVCIIGASGAGKSTFLRCINRLERPDPGYVLVDGQLVGYSEDRSTACTKYASASSARARAGSAWCSSASTCSST